MNRVKSKFGDYFVGYAACGSWFTRGFDARQDSDIDVIVLFDDIDCQKLGRLELSRKIREIVAAMGAEAAMDAGLPTAAIHGTSFILSDALRSLHEGNVVLFSMLDKAFVLFDPRSYLRTWQLLMRSGCLVPSSQYAEALLENSRRDVFYPYKRIRDAVVDDLYSGVVAAAQSLLLRLGERVLPPDRVAPRLRECATNCRPEVDRDEIGRLADTVDKLLAEMRTCKTKPYIHITATRLAELMSASEHAFQFVEAACKKLIGESDVPCGSPPVVGHLCPEGMEPRDE